MWLGYRATGAALRRQLAEEGMVPFAHHDRHQVDRHLVEQPQLQALPGDGAPGDRHDAVAGELLGPRDADSTPSVTKVKGASG